MGMQLCWGWGTQAENAELQNTVSSHRAWDATRIREIGVELRKRIMELETEVADLQRRRLSFSPGTIRLPWFGFEVTPSALVSSVGKGSAAAAAGVLVGDKLLTVNDAPVGVRTEVLALPFTFEREGSAKVFTIAVQCISVIPVGRYDSWHPLKKFSACPFFCGYP